MNSEETMSQYEQGSTVPKRTWDGGASDDYLYVGKRDGRYLIVRRSASVDYPNRVQPDERVLADATVPSCAVLEASKIGDGLPVKLQPKVRKKLGWSKRPSEDRNFGG